MPAKPPFRLAHACPEVGKKERPPNFRSTGVFSRWRRRPDLNRWVEVLQTSALPLGYAATKEGPDLRGTADRCQVQPGRAAQKKRSMNSGSFVMSMDLQK